MSSNIIPQMSRFQLKNDLSYQKISNEMRTGANRMTVTSGSCHKGCRVPTVETPTSNYRHVEAEDGQKRSGRMGLSTKDRTSTSPKPQKETSTWEDGEQRVAKKFPNLAEEVNLQIQERE